MKLDEIDTGSTAVRERPETRFSSWRSEVATRDFQKKLEVAGRPGPAHQVFESLAGNWRAEVRCWIEPDGPPEMSLGSARIFWTLSGRFLEEEFHGEMMGRPYTGRTLMGFDNIKQTFNSVSVSDIQTSMFTCEGKGEHGNKLITMEGRATCMASDCKDIPMRTVMRIISPVKHTVEMFDRSKGDNVKTMEITYTRR